MSNDPEQAPLDSASALLREALRLLDDQGLAVAAAQLDGVIQMVEAASLRDAQVVR
ncbi:hypothetical protein [Sphingomonas sp. Leaf21]|uniref:hypothetical protein n=1 Tax=Sphingomonas sp. Leaf21 TaxID=2876550 RepID=UPI001E2F4BD5|nr:hypothetical protein [Sphingomonas sp. Leaf21]